MKSDNQPLRFETGWDTDDGAFNVELAIYYWPDSDGPVIDRVQVLELADYNCLGQAINIRKRQDMPERERKTYDSLLLDYVQHALHAPGSDLLEDLGKHAEGQR